MGGREWAAIIGVFIILLLIVAIYLVLQFKIQGFINQFNIDQELFCKEAKYISYNEFIFDKDNKNVYNVELAEFLVTLSLNVSIANCTNLLPIPNPPTFNNQLRIEGINPSSKQTNMFAYIFWNDEYAIVSFTGTVFLSEWLLDFQYQQVPPDQFFSFLPGTLVHRGFYSIYMAIRDQIVTWRDNNKTQQLIITGHSLGGALATLCSYDFGTTGDTSNVSYTFGSPRVGNILFSSTYNGIVPNSFRVENTEDIVTSLPPPLIDNWLYQHVKNNVPFTVTYNTDTYRNNHIAAYLNYIPECPEVALSSCSKPD